MTTNMKSDADIRLENKVSDMILDVFGDLVDEPYSDVTGLAIALAQEIIVVVKG